jgi:hypothetical protein
MSEFQGHTCVICGAPATHCMAPTVEERDDAGELRQGQEQVVRRYYCERHRPHIHGEPLEDRLG